jgi:hypothetical protein
MASSLQVKPRSFTTPLCRSWLTRWGSASFEQLEVASDAANKQSGELLLVLATRLL